MRRTRFLRLFTLILLMPVLAALPAACNSAPKQAQPSLVIREWPGPSLNGFPERANRISVNIYRKPGQRYSKQSPRVILISGWTCGAGWLHFVARYLSLEQGIEVWTINRRPTLLEDRTTWSAALAACRAGKLAPDTLVARLRNAHGFAVGDLECLKGFGLRESIHDMHAVVLRAAADGRPLFLGGWSDGVEFVMAYSLTRFAGGRAGHTFLRGMLFIDENPEWGRTSPDRMQARAAALQARIKRGDYLERFLRTPQLFESAALGGTNRNPLARFFPGQPFGSRPASGRALLGWIFDGGGRRSPLSWLLSCGRPRRSASGMADWQSGDTTPMQRVLAMHQAPAGVWEWFYPLRIMVDYWRLGAAGLTARDFPIAPDRTARLPVFAVFSAMNRFSGNVPAGISWYLQRTGIGSDKVRVLKRFAYKHGDILLSPRAEKTIWLPAARWIRTQSGATSP